jgi:hypothetical protein
VSGCLRILCAAVLVAVVAGTNAGCQRDFSNQNDILREQVMDLEEKVDALERRNRELEAELARIADEPGSLPAEIRANIPNLVEISIDRLSHALDTDNDGRADLLRVYVEAADGRGRFIQLVGSVSVHAAVLPAEDESITIGQRTFPADAVRDAYRSSFMGTHYTFELPIDLPEAIADAASASLQIGHVDGRTGRTHEAQRAIQLLPARDDSE